MWAPTCTRFAFRCLVSLSFAVSVVSFRHVAGLAPLPACVMMVLSWTRSSACICHHSVAILPTIPSSFALRTPHSALRTPHGTASHLACLPLAAAGSLCGSPSSVWLGSGFPLCAHSVFVFSVVSVFCLWLLFAFSLSSS